jgi:hypothetical protein
MLILSDLQLEFSRISPVELGERIDECVDVVVLAGDIVEGVKGIRWARETFITKGSSGTTAAVRSTAEVRRGKPDDCFAAIAVGGCCQACSR